MGEIFQRQMKENGYTREDMEALIELGTTISPPQPKSKAWIKEHCEGRYHLTSKYSGGDTIPLKTVPGYREELRRNPGQQKRTWEDKEYQAIGNPSASSNGPPYQANAAGRIAETRRLKAESEQRQPGEDQSEKVIRVESQRFVQQQHAKGQKPSPAYGEPGYVVPGPAGGNPTPKGKGPYYQSKDGTTRSSWDKRWY
jgi:hypothetical protein